MHESLLYRKEKEAFLVSAGTCRFHGCDRVSIPLPDRQRIDSRNRSASTAAMQPVPTAVTACRYV
jgi:hypothetical protein